MPDNKTETKAAESKAGKNRIRNIANGPRFFHTASGGTITLDPGQEWEGAVDVTQFERRDPDGLEFELNGKQAPAIKKAIQSDEFDKLSDQQLRDAAQKKDTKKQLPSQLTREELLDIVRS